MLKRRMTLLNYYIKSSLKEIMLYEIIPYIPLASSQHGFHPMHSTTINLSSLSQFILDGFTKKEHPFHIRYMQSIQHCSLPFANRQDPEHHNAQQ